MKVSKNFKNSRRAALLKFEGMSWKKTLVLPKEWNLKISVSQEWLVVWRWYSPHFNRNAHISIAFSNIERSRVEYQAWNSQFLQKICLKMAKYEKRQYLRNGWSYEDDLPLILTAMPTFLLHFQILKGEKSTIKPKIANFCKIFGWRWLNMRKGSISGTVGPMTMIYPSF